MIIVQQWKNERLLKNIALDINSCRIKNCTSSANLSSVLTGKEVILFILVNRTYGWYFRIRLVQTRDNRSIKLVLHTCHWHFVGLVYFLSHNLKVINHIQVIIWMDDTADAINFGRLKWVYFWWLVMYMWVSLSPEVDSYDYFREFPKANRE